MKATTGRAPITTKSSCAAPRLLSEGERRADAWVHGIAIIAAVVGVAALIVVALPRENLPLIVSLLVYGCGLLVMWTCSALYNASNVPERRGRLRRFDHAAIFVMIAGTYTPFLAARLAGPWSCWLLVYVWVIAAGGVILKLIWVDRFPRLSVGLYLVLGWTIVVAIEPLLASMSRPAILLLVIGGVLYSVGVLFHLWERLPYNQVIWHGFVAAAAVCHYAAVVGEVALPGSIT